MKTLKDILIEALIKKDTTLYQASKLKDDEDTFDRFWYLMVDIFSRKDVKGNYFCDIIKKDYNNDIIKFLKNTIEWPGHPLIKKLTELVQTEFNDDSITLEDICRYINRHDKELLKAYDEFRLD